MGRSDDAAVIMVSRGHGVLAREGTDELSGTVCKAVQVLEEVGIDVVDESGTLTEAKSS